MGGGGKKKAAAKLEQFPTVSICTPTFNRRPFIPTAIQCVLHQDYPADKIEWIILDDGTDKVGDLVAHLPFVRYHAYDEKMTLGRKRNLANQMATGKIIVFMDDDDYYPPERISHAVSTLRKSKALCAGSSAMYIYFKHIQTMYVFGPYGPNHATAATFAFKRELLERTAFNETSSVAEEKQFLKDYTIPFVQLDPRKTIVVFSHDQNSFDKKELLVNVGRDKNIHPSDVTPADLVKEEALYRFFMHDIDEALRDYDSGRSSNKGDVQKQLTEIRSKRAEMTQQAVKAQTDLVDMVHLSALIQASKSAAVGAGSGGVASAFVTPMRRPGQKKKAGVTAAVPPDAGK